jgi:hypothetical protein
MLDRVHPLQPAPRERRLLMRLCLFAFCGGLLLLLSSRPAEAAERREPGLLGPVGTTLKATAREVDSFAGRATGSRSSTVAKATNAARQVTAPPPRPATGAARPAAAPTVKRGAPAVTSRSAGPRPRPVPPPRPPGPQPVRRRHHQAGDRGRLLRAGRQAGHPHRHPHHRPPGSGRRRRRRAPGPGRRGHRWASGPGHRGHRWALGPVAEDRLCPPVDSPGNLTQRCATLPLRGPQPGAGSLKGVLAPVVGLAGPVLRPVAPCSPRSSRCSLRLALHSPRLALHSPRSAPRSPRSAPRSPRSAPRSLRSSARWVGCCRRWFPGCCRCLGWAGREPGRRLGSGGLRLWLPSRGSGASCLHPLLPR